MHSRAAHAERPWPVVKVRFQLVLQWPETSCRIHHTCPVPDHVPRKMWTIRGLWPDLGQHQHCHHSESNFDVLWDMLSPNMQRWAESHWHEFSGSMSTADFIKQEWENHGSCMGMSFLDYMFLTKMLSEKYDVYSMMSHYAVIPTLPAFGYTMFEVLDALTLSLETGDSVMLRCRRGILHTVHICLSGAPHYNPVSCLGASSPPKCDPLPFPFKPNSLGYFKRDSLA